MLNTLRQITKHCTGRENYTHNNADQPALHTPEGRLIGHVFCSSRLSIGLTGLSRKRRMEENTQTHVKGTLAHSLQIPGFPLMQDPRLSSHAVTLGELRHTASLWCGESTSLAASQGRSFFLLYFQFLPPLEL